MACRGVLFALTEAERAKLIDIADAADDVEAFIKQEVEEKWDEDWLCETDKAWDAIHRCLTDSTLSEDDGTPLHWCILNGAQMIASENYIVSFVDQPGVADVSAALETVTIDSFRKKYEAIDPQGYQGRLSQDDFEYTWAYFEDVREFYKTAAQAGRSVVFTVDQ